MLTAGKNYDGFIKNVVDAMQDDIDARLEPIINMAQNQVEAEIRACVAKTSIALARHVQIDTFKDKLTITVLFDGRKKK